MRRGVVKRSKPGSCEPDATALFPGCTVDEIRLGKEALRRISDVLEGRVDARSARSVLAAAALLLVELCLEREADQ